MSDLIPEPPDSAWIVVGDDPHVLLVRDDYSAREGGCEPGHHWFYGHDGMVPPLSWAQLTGPQPVDGWPGADRSVIRQVYTKDELDQAVADGDYEQIGEHRIALSAGRCVLHGEVYQPHELDRLRERERDETEGVGTSGD